MSEASIGYVRPMWERIGTTVIGRHLFDLTNGWEGHPASRRAHRRGDAPARPDCWHTHTGQVRVRQHPEASCRFIDDVAAAIAAAKGLAGERDVAVAAVEVGGQALALGLVDEVAMDVVPVVFGSGKRCFGSVDAHHLLEDPDVVVRGSRVLHLRYPVRR